MSAVAWAFNKISLMSNKDDIHCVKYGGTFTRAGAFFLILIGLFVCFGSCQDNDYGAQASNAAPILELPIDADATVSTCGNLLMGAGYDVVCVWDWNDLGKEPQKAKIDDSWMPDWKSKMRPYPPNFSCALIPRGSIIGASHTKDDTSIRVLNINGGGHLDQKSLGPQWDCRRLRNTRNGRWVAVLLAEDYEYVFKDESPTARGRFRLGRMQAGSAEVGWVTTVYRSDSFLPDIWAIAASEDGKYLAAVGTKNAGFIHVADVAQQKVLWEKRPRRDDVPIGDWTVNFNDVCFSPDSKRIYVAGNLGVFCFDRVTGKILTQWPMEGGRCVSVDVSPDGRLVAGGTVASGLVSIYEAKTGKLLDLFQTGQFSIYSLTFSPDSTRLATSGVKNTNIKIWKMPGADSPSEQTGQRRSQRKS